MKYLFETQVCMKPYNSKNFWIDNDICKQVKITADNLRQAIEKYCNYIYEQSYISISQNAIKNKQPIYYDDKDGNAIQCGYVFTGKTDIENTQQFVDVWVSICKIEEVEF